MPKMSFINIFILFAVLRASAERSSSVYIKPVEGDLVDLRTVRLPSKTPEFDGYNPKLVRDPKHPIQPWMAYLNLLKTSFSSGMLGLPFAVSHAGMLFGPLLIIGVGLLTIHTSFTLLWCLNEISRQLKISHISYRYGFRVSCLHGPPCMHELGNWGPCLIAFFMVLSQIGMCTIFVILTGDNLRDIMDWTNILPALLCLYVPYMVLEILMKNLTIVSYVSTAGMVLNATALILVFYELIAYPHGETSLGPHSLLSILLAFGTILFTLNNVGVVLACDKALKSPYIMTSRYGVIHVGVAVSTVAMCVFGCLGYYSFGPMEENVLRVLPCDNLITLVIFGVYMVSTLFTFPLQSYPGIKVVVGLIHFHDPEVTLSSQSLKLAEHIGRPTFVTVCFVIAYFVPFQATLVAFVGNLCTTILALAGPAIMEIGILYPNKYGKYKYLLFKDILLIGLGVFVWCFGVCHCIYHIYILILMNQSPNKADGL